MEVSSKTSAIPLKVLKDSNSITDYYIYFEKVYSARGYNIYEGTIGKWYSHSIGANLCSAIFFDLGTGNLRAELNPSRGNHYYLITAFGGGVEGPSSFDSNNFEIPESQSSCNP